jgi:COMPASS component SWD2
LSANFNETGIPIEVGFTPDSKYVISGSENRKILIWNIETGKELQMMEFHPKPVTCIKFSHVYCMMISACQNIVVWIPEKTFTV